jgi:hypothetical protein
MEGLVIRLASTVVIAGAIVMRSGEPLPRATGTGLFAVGPSVVAEPADGSVSLPVSSAENLHVPETSSFEVRELLPGAYVLRIGYPFDRPERWCCVVVRSITWQGEDYTDRPFDTAAGHDFNGVVMTLDQAATIGGFVRDAEGKPVTDRVVVFFPADRSRWQNTGINPRGFGTALVNTDGSYALGQVPGGDYYFAVAGIAGEDQSWRSPESLAALAAGSRPVHVEWGGQLTQDLVAK